MRSKRFARDSARSSTRSIGRLFLESDIYHLWDMIQEGGPESYDTARFADYGTDAVGTLLR